MTDWPSRRQRICDSINRGFTPTMNDIGELLRRVDALEGELRAALDQYEARWAMGAEWVDRARNLIDGGVK